MIAKDAPWILRQLEWSVWRPIRARSGPLARLIRIGRWWRWPWSARELAVARDSGMGDVLMGTALLRAAKRRDPKLKTIFYTTTFAELVRGLPYIDEVRNIAHSSADAIYLNYEDALPPKAPLPQIMADNARVNLDGDLMPDCVVDPARKASVEADLSGYPTPRIVILRKASQWTPNKEWPDDRWLALLDRLSQSATIIEIGAPTEAAGDLAADHYIDFRGKTSVTDLPAIFAAADLYVGPVSGPMHIAAAVNTPGVAICGGYEHPLGYAYPNIRMLYTATQCAPCWLTEPCPFGKKCLTAISVDEVERAVWEMCRRDEPLVRAG